jgi:hypothetical protein
MLKLFGILVLFCSIFGVLLVDQKINVWGVLIYSLVAVGVIETSYILTCVVAAIKN